MHRDEAHRPIAQAAHGAAHRLGDVVELEVEEELLAGAGQLVHQREVVAAHQQLEAELVEVHRIAERAHEPARVVGRGDVERCDQAFTRGNRAIMTRAVYVTRFRAAGAASHTLRRAPAIALGICRDTRDPGALDRAEDRVDARQEGGLLEYRLGRAAARGDPCQAARWIDREDEREIGARELRLGLREQPLRIEAARALVGHRREEVAIREDEPTRSECGLDHPHDVLAPVLDEPAKLLFGRDALAGARHRADALTPGAVVGSCVVRESMPRARR